MKVDFAPGAEGGSEQLPNGHVVVAAAQSGPATHDDVAAQANAGQTPGGFMAQPAAKTPAPSPTHPEYHLPTGDKVVHIHLNSGDTTFRLPASASFDTIRVVGNDLVLVQKDGTAIVLDEAADKVPNVAIGDVEVPKDALAAAFTDNGIQAAEGPSSPSTPGSSGGNFAGEGRDIGQSFPLTPLQAPEGFGFTPTAANSVLPTIDFTPGSAGAGSSLSVNESGLLGGSAPLAGPDSATTNVSFRAGSDSLSLTLAPAAPTTTLPGGETIVWTNLDGQHVIGKENGVAVVEFSIATTTIGAGSTETVAVTETLLAPITGEGSAAGNLGAVNVVATDSNGSQFVDRVTTTVVDDAPVAHADAASAADGATLTVAAGSGLFSASNTGGADVSGADAPITVTGVAAGTSAGAVSGHVGAAVTGADGTLTLNADGSFSYAANHNVKVGSVDTFSYTITDNDGSTSTSTLAITIGAGAAAVGGATAALSVNESALAAGSSPSPAGLTTSTQVAFTAGADDLHVTLNSSALTTTLAGFPNLTWTTSANGQEIEGFQGATEVVKFDITAGSTILAGTTGDVTVTETLLAPIAGEGTAAGNLGTLTVTGTDNVNPADVTDTVTTTVVDDAPKANAGAASAADGATLTVDAAHGLFGASGAADVTGADTPTTVTGVAAGTSAGAVSGHVGAAVTGADGTLTLNADGSFSYAANHNVKVGSVDTFSYTITDNDGSTSTSTLAITIGAGAAAVGGATAALSVNESALAAGSSPSPAGLTTSTQVAFTAGADDLHVTLNSSALTTTLAGFPNLTWTTSANGQEIEGFQGATEVVKFDITAGSTILAGTTGDVTVTETLLAPIAGEGTAAGNLGTLTVTGTDNVNPADVTDTVTTTVVDDAPKANAGAASAADGATLTVDAAHGLFGASGAADVTGADTPTTVTGVAAGTSAGLVNGHVGAAVTGADGTLTLNADGSFSYAASNNMKVGSVDTFSYTITDSDGTTSTSTLAITIGAGAAAVGGATSALSVNESALAAGSAPSPQHLTDSAKVAFTAGADDLHVTLNSSALTTTLAGFPSLTWTTSANGQEIEGFQGATEVVKFDITAGSTILAGTTADVTVTETLLAPIAGEGTATGNLGALTVTGTDTVNPASVTDTVTATVVDDAPVAHVDAATAVDGGVVVTSLTGGATSVLSNDVVGADSPVFVTSVKSGATTQALVGSGASASATIAGADGTLTLHGDGTFSYAPNHNVAAGSVDTFHYTIADADGTTSTSTLAITIGAGAAPVGGTSGSEYVLESALATGSAPSSAGLTASAQVAFTAGADDLHLSLGTSGLTNTLPGFTWTAVNGGQEIQGWQNGVEVVKFDLSTPTLAAGTTGDVTVTETLLHVITGDGTATNDLGSVTVTGTDTVNPASVIDTVTVGVVDDAPTANADAASAVDGGAAVTSLTGNVSSVLANDVMGADSPVFVTSVTSGATTVPLVGWGASATTTITGADGKLTLNGDGTFSYAANNNVKVGSVDTFSYTITDSDGSTSASTLAITIGAGAAAVGGATSAVSVNESALAAGSAPNPAGLTTSAQVAFTAGADDLHVTLNSSALTTTLAGFPNLTWTTSANGQEIEGSQNGVEVVKFDITAGSTIDAGTTGDVTVTETLLAPIAGEGTATGNLGTLTVTGTDTVNPADVTDTVTASVVDDAPVANADTAKDISGNLLSGNVVSGAGDVTPAAGKDVAGADQPVTVAGVEAGSHASDNLTAGVGTAITGAYGTLTMAADGSYTYQAKANDPTGTDTFTYTIKDADGSTSTTTLTIDVAAAQLTASAATGTVYEAGLPTIGSGVGPTTIAQSGTLTLSETGDTVTVASVAGFHGATSVDASGTTTVAGEFGTLTISANGVYSYTLTTAETGTTPDQFTYTATDTHGNTTTNTLTFDIVDDAPVAKADTANDVSGNLLSGNVVSGAGDVTPAAGKDVPGADQPVTVSGVEAGSHASDTLTAGVGTAITGAYGTLTMAADGSYTYQAKPNDPTGTDTFTYTIKDADGSTSTTTLTIDVAAAQLTASAATGTVYEAGLPAIGYGVGPTTITQAGTLTLSEIGDTVTVTSVNGGAVAANGDTTIVGAHGTLTIDAQGVYTYTLTSPETTNPAPDSFTYTATDSHGNVTTSTLSFTIVDDKPVAVADAATDNSGHQLAANVITGTGETSGGDTTSADKPVTVSGVESGSDTSAILTTGVGTAITTTLGTLTMLADGSYTYQAKANESGTDTFTYTIKDADSSTSTTTLAIAVNEVQPTAAAATGTVYEAGLATGSHPNPTTITQSGTLSFSESGDTVTLTGVNGSTVAASGNTTIAGAHGTLTIDAQGVYSYTLTSSETNNATPDSFSYTATDSHGNVTTSTLSFTIVDDKPVAVADAATDNSGHQLAANVITGTGETSGGDTTSADKPVTVSGVESGSDTSAILTTGVGTAIATSLGTLTMLADGSYTYQAKANESGTDTFTYTITDGDGSTSTTTLAIAVNAVHPAASAASGTVYEAGLATGSHVGNTTITQSGTLSFSESGDTVTLTGVNGSTVAPNGNTTIAGAHGTLTIDAHGDYSYTLTSPETNNPAPDSFTYTVTDSHGNATTSTLNFTVVDDAPKFVSADHGEIANVSGVGVLTGSLNYLTGADTPVSLAFTGVSHNQASATATSYTSDGLNVSEYVDSSGVLHGFTSSGGVDTDVFTVSLNAANSTYSFDLFQPLDAFQAAAVTLGGDVSNSKTYALISDASGNQVAVLTGYDTAHTSFNFSNWFYESSNTLNSSDLTQGHVNASSNGEGVGNDNFNPTEFMRFDFGAVSDTWSYGSASGAPSNATQVNQATFTFNMTGGSNSVIDYVVHDTDGTVSNGSISMNGYSTLTINGHGPIDYIELYDVSGSPKVELTGVSETANSGTMTLPFSIGITDNDGSTASGAFDVTATGGTMSVNYGSDSSIPHGLNGTYTEIQDTSAALGGTGVTSATNVLIGGSENDIFISQFGPDTMTGGGGNDIFKLENINAHDIITDFSVAHDTVDLTALLTNVSTSNPLADYVNYNSTTGVLSVNQTGSGTIATNPTDFHAVATLDVGNSATVHPASSSVSVAYTDTTHLTHAHTV